MKSTLTCSQTCPTESDHFTLFLLIRVEQESAEADSFTNEEMIYTAITRCRCNLCVINVNNEKYHEFFSKAIV